MRVTLQLRPAVYLLKSPHAERDGAGKAARAPARDFGKPWTEGEDKLLAAEFDAGVPMGEIARKHLRTQSSIRLRLEKLRKIEPQPAQ